MLICKVMLNGNVVRTQINMDFVYQITVADSKIVVERPKEIGDMVLEFENDIEAYHAYLSGTCEEHYDELYLAECQRKDGSKYFVFFDTEEDFYGAINYRKGKIDSYKID